MKEGGARDGGGRRSARNLIQQPPVGESEAPRWVGRRTACACRRVARAGLPRLPQARFAHTTARHGTTRQGTTRHDTTRQGVRSSGPHLDPVVVDVVDSLSTGKEKSESSPRGLSAGPIPSPSEPTSRGDAEPTDKPGKQTAAAEGANRCRQVGGRTPVPGGWVRGGLQRRIASSGPSARQVLCLPLRTRS